MAASLVRKLENLNNQSLNEIARERDEEDGNKWKIKGKRRLLSIQKGN